MSETMIALWLDVRDDRPPPAVGWYATMWCWEIREGLFVGASHWDGRRWSNDRPFVQRSAQTFLTEVDAEAWARAHDPEK